MRENTRVCKYGACAFLLRKSGCSDSTFRVAAACFAVTVCVWIPPSARIALTVTARKPTEYCFIDAVWESGGNPEQPSIAVS